MKKVLRKIFAFLLIVSVLLLPAALPVEAAATNSISNGMFYMLQNLNSGMFLAAASSTVTSGINVLQSTYAYNTYTPLIFQLDTAENGISSNDYHRILPMNNLSLCLDVDNASNSTGANIKIFDQNPGYGAQSFKFLENADGTFHIQPHLSTNRVLGVASNSTSNHANVQLVAYNANSASQKWILKRVKPADRDYFDMNWRYFFHASSADCSIRISQRFDLPRGGEHKGVDITAMAGYSVSGRSVFSPCDGTVVDRGYERTMGNYIIIETDATDTYGNHLTIRLMHLRDDPRVTKGQTVDNASWIGVAGNTGISSGPHLHVDVNNGGHYSGSDIYDDPTSAINPESFFPQIMFVYGESSDNVTYSYMPS